MSAAASPAMKRITVPMAAMSEYWRQVSPVGRSMIVVVRLDWPQLRLTENQLVQNSVARALGHEPPHPDPALIEIELPYVPELSQS